MDWFNLSDDTNTVMKFRFHEMLGSFWLATNMAAFQRRTQLKEVSYKYFVWKILAVVSIWEKVLVTYVNCAFKFHIINWARVDQSL
jgi:hypothetical protein